MRVCVTSLGYNPSHLAHIVAYGKAFREAGADVCFCVHAGYGHNADLLAVAPVMTHDTPDRKLLDSCTHALIYNAAVGNPAFAWRMRQSGAKVAYVYHEPWVSLARLWGEVSITSLARLMVSRLITLVLLRLCHLVVLPSAEAAKNYRARDARINPSYLEMSLIFDDNYYLAASCERRTFSYIGTISHAHAFDQFVEFMRYALQRNLGIRFLIASRHTFSDQELLARYSDQITVRCGKPLTNEEIIQSYAQSVCIWNLYRLSTQSGVMANAFMCGTPVIANRTGAFNDFVREGYNGRFATPEDPDEIAQAYASIATSLDSYVANCRESFLNNFFYRAQMNTIRQILNI